MTWPFYAFEQSALTPSWCSRNICCNCRRQSARIRYPPCRARAAYGRELLASAVRDDDCARLAVRAAPEQSVFTNGARWCNLSGVPRERTICLAHPRTQYLSPGSRSDTDTDLPGRRLTRAAPNPYSMGTDRREKFLGTRGRWEMERMQS